MSSTLPRKLPKKSLAKLITVATLALFVAVSALPQYSSGWSWTTPPKLPQASRVALQAMPDQGLALPGWTTNEQINTKLGGHTWSIQQLSPDPASGEKTAQESVRSKTSSIVLLLRPQIYGADQPEVEWLDVKGSQRWKTDSHQKLFVDVPMSDNENTPLKSSKNPRTVRISSDFFRAWSKEQTYAVLQWYAWPTGGSASPSRWFWADQKAQWHRHQRMPWVAVSLWLPIAPLGDIASRTALAESLASSLQQTLLQTIFQSAPTDTTHSPTDGHSTGR